MKILHITPSFYPAMVYGGPTYSVYRLCVSLAENKQTVRVLTTDANGPRAVLNVKKNEDLEISKGLTVRYCNRWMPNSLAPALLYHLSSYIRWADIVHLMAVYSFPTIPTFSICKTLGKPLVWSPRGMLQRWQGSSNLFIKSIWENVCRFAAPEQMLLHFTSEEERSESLSRFPSVKSIVLPNGVEIPETIHHNENQNEFRFLYLGRLHPKKGIENLLQAYSTINGSMGMNALLVIAGGGDSAYTDFVRLKISQLGLTKKVNMIGPVHGEQKEKLFQDSHVVIVPSHTENFGMVVAEAFAHELPVIASRGTPWRRIEEHNCGLWVDNDPESLANAMKQISSMPIREMGKNGRAWMEQEFAWPKIADSMIQAYQRLLDS